MELNEISCFYDRPCRFKLKSGKEVYGVIWENLRGELPEHYFASSKEYSIYRKAESENDQETCNLLKQKIDIDDLVAAEYLPGFSL